MKHLLYLLLFISSAAYSQPSFNANHCFQVGDSNRIAYATILRSLDTEIQFTGTNYTWDYSLQLWQNPKNSYVFQEANKSVHTTFANSEINELGFAVFSRDLFYTYSNDKDTLYLDGLYSNTSSKYSPRIPYLNFPLNYGDTSKVYLKQFANPNAPTLATGSVSRYWVYDGFGTLNLGFATIPNVYRIHMKQTDSLYLAQFDFTTDELVYFRQSDGVPVLRLQRYGTFVAAFYGSAMNATGVDKINTSTLSVYPNPTQDKIYVHGILDVSSIDNIPYELFSIDGKKVQSGLLINNYVDVGGLENGVYMLKVENAFIKIVASR